MYLSWINVKKSFDFVDHEYLIGYIKNYKFTGLVNEFLFNL